MKQKIRRRTEADKQSPTSAPKHANDTKRFSDHIGELRRRVFFVALAFIVASSLVYNYHDQLVQLIMAPLDGQKLIYLTPGGGFNFIFQVSLYAGIIATAPMLIYQIYGFIRPALPARAQRSAVKVVIIAFLLMLCGVAFGYFVAVPSALTFLSNFAGSDIAPNLTADSYLSFFLAYLAGLGVLFELPLLLLFFHWIHPMTPGKLLKSERFVILFAFVASAIITPTPDVFNQSMIAVPLIAIYQLGVIIVLLTIRHDHKLQRKQVSQPEVAAPVAPTPIRAAISRPPQVPKQVAAPIVAPVKVPIKPVVRRGVDGFVMAPSRPAPKVQPVPPRTERLAAPTRPQSNFRRPLSVDGFFV